MTERVIVVGGGVAGLAAAAALSGQTEVELVERLPEVGGTWGFEHPRIVELRRTCVELGVTLTLGVTALRWSEGRLLLIGPGTRCWRTAGHLVFAGGTRPATPAELRLFGARVAGVFAGTVAHHLLGARVKLGSRPIVCGGGYWAERVLAELTADARPTLVGPEARFARGIPAWPGFRPTEVRGEDRVRELVIAREGDEHTLACDCVVLAGDPRPLRNVDGAITPSSDVTFAQLCQETVTPSDVVEHAVSVVGSCPRRRV